MRAPMTALNASKTVRRPAFRAGRPQVWEATSADGVWLYVRLEDAGTPWIVRHLPSGTEVDALFGTLSACRRATASWLAEAFSVEEAA